MKQATTEHNAQRIKKKPICSLELVMHKAESVPNHCRIRHPRRTPLRYRRNCFAARGAFRAALAVSPAAPINRLCAGSVLVVSSVCQVTVDP